MNIEIRKPELEALIQQQLRSGAFRNVEDVLMHALRLASAVGSGHEATGADLVAAMQACPIKDIDLEPERFPMPVRDITF